MEPRRARPVRLQWSKSLDRPGKPDDPYGRFTVTLSSELVEEIGWEKGDVLQAEVEGEGKQRSIRIRRLASAPSD